MSKIYYLSNPYAGTDEQKAQRAKAAGEICYQLMDSGLFVFSPIVHNHALVSQFPNMSVEDRRRIFLPFDFTMLKKCDAMILLKLEGWEQSSGCAQEIAYCQEYQLPMYELEDGADVEAFLRDNVRREM